MTKREESYIMPTTIHPTLLLSMDLDESLYNEETVTEIKRSYLYIAPVTVVTHPANPDALENNLRLIIKLRRPYWNSDVAGADDIWENSMRKWLKTIFSKVSSTLTGINRTAHRSGHASLRFSWLEIQFDGLVIALHLGSEAEIPDVTHDLIDCVRSMSNDGPLEELAPALVRLPSRQSNAKQEAAAEEAAAESELAADFDRDFSIWGLEFSDGSQKQYDQSTNSIIA
jgi:hypothetical protein